MAFGALIRKHRRLKGLTLKQISAPLGVSVAYWCRIEQDAGTPPRDAAPGRPDRTGSRHPGCAGG